jgi:aryl-alcohol dehydrogenase-like predicted oxidoreductase
MERRQLGHSGLDVPVVGMGTWKTFDISDRSSIDQRRCLVDICLEHGANLFDSSPMYGAAERVLGEALAGRRDQALIATKVWTPDDTQAERQIHAALSYYESRVDIYQVHNLVAWQKRLTTLERLRDNGSVRVVGITHYQHSAFGDLMQIMRSGRIGSIQVPYNVRDRVVEDAVLPLSADLGIGVIIMQPLGTGALAARGPESSALAPLADFGVRTWSQALLKWILSDPRVTTVIPATSKSEHAVQNVEAGTPPWFGPEERSYVARLAQ